MLCCIFFQLGYIGYLPSDESIYAVFRGTGSIRNWVTDINTFKTPYLSFPNCKCQVHKGFYEAEQKVIDRVIAAVHRLQIMLPQTYSLKVTGYSLGAALAQFVAMDLIKNGYQTTVYNFGMPRTGKI